jgi:hypothetical protein
LLSQLESEHTNARDIDVVALERLLTTGTPKDKTASESQFYGRVGEAPGNRIVLNADMRDLGVDLLKGFEAKMAGVHDEASAQAAGASANDHIYNLKREKLQAIRAAYRTELLAKAKQLAVSQHRLDLLEQLDGEPELVVLLGGDEITVSLAPAFKELGLVDLAVSIVAKANARVSLAEGNGVEGHRTAIATAETAHGTLKRYEELAKMMERASQTSGKAPELARLIREIRHLYTATTESGQIELRSTEGTPTNSIRKRAEELLPERAGVIKQIFEK